MGPRQILVLVIASDFPRHYVDMQELWTRHIANMCVNADVWFIKAKPPHLWLGDIVNDGPLSDIVELDREAMTIFVKGNETYIPGILNKTIEAIRAMGLSNYDFIWRTNLSSVLNFAGLAKYIDSLCVSSMFMADLPDSVSMDLCHSLPVPGSSCLATLRSTWFQIVICCDGI